MASSQNLSRLAQDAEDVASSLQFYREHHGNAPNITTSITDAVSRLFGVSTILRRLADAQETREHQHSLHRIQRDVAIVYRSIHYTVEVALDMVHRADHAAHMIWGDLEYRMRDVERAGFLERLNWYQVYVELLLQLLDGRSSDRLSRIREKVQTLVRAQEEARPIRPMDRYIEPVANTPRPPAAIAWPPPQTPVRAEARPHYATYASSSAFSDDSFTEGRPPAPEVPDLMHSPTLTSDSSQTLVSSGGSSHSYSPRHWAEDVFVGLQGSSARSAFLGDLQLDIPTHCTGHAQSDAKHILAAEGFMPLTEARFVDNDSVATFYYRPSDQRARVFLATDDQHAREGHFCLPLTHLIIIRDQSVLTLCRAKRGDNSLVRWATLKFIHYERMVLFYSTFVALKRQDSHPTPRQLAEQVNTLNERELYGGVIRDGSMLHALRLFHEPDAGDAATGVYRLEASPLRGGSEGVPIWTAFLSKYVALRDAEFFNLEREGFVTMCCPKPEPFVFVPGWRLPVTRHGEYVLEFDTRRDATEFKVEWNRICNSARRS